MTTTADMSTVVSGDARRFTIVNLKQVNELPLRNALQSFDKNGDGKIDISELQKIIYWYGLWKYASFGLCMIIMTLVWSTFGLTIWAINLTKEYTVTDGVLTGSDDVVKMSVASTHIPLSWATLLDRRHLDALESVSLDITQGSGNFPAGVYHMKVVSYLHANSTYLKLFGADGSRVWVNSGTVVLHHPDAEEAVMVCGAAACNTLAVDVKPEYLQQLTQRSAELFASSQDFEVPRAVEGVAINKAAGENATCQAAWKKAYIALDGAHFTNSNVNIYYYKVEPRDRVLIHQLPVAGEMLLPFPAYGTMWSWTQDAAKEGEDLHWSNPNAHHTQVDEEAFGSVTVAAPAGDSMPLPDRFGADAIKHGALKFSLSENIEAMVNTAITGTDRMGYDGVDDAEDADRIAFGAVDNAMPDFLPSPSEFKLAGESPKRRRLMYEPYVQAVSGVSKGNVRDNGFDILNELDQQKDKVLSGLPAKVVGYEQYFDKVVKAEGADRRRLSNLDGTPLFRISDNGYDLIQKKAAKNLIPATTPIKEYAFGKDIMKFADIPAGRRRLQSTASTNAFIGTLSDATTGRADRSAISNNSAYPQANASQMSAAGGGTSQAKTANAEKNQAVGGFLGRRRLGGANANEIVEKLDNTAISSTVDNFHKNAMKIDHAVRTQTAGGTQKVHSAVKNFASQFTRRRLSNSLLNENVENIDDTDLFGIMDNGFNASDDDDDEVSMAEDMGVLNNDDVEEEISNENADFQTRRRLGSPALGGWKIAHGYVDNVDTSLGVSGILNVVEKAGGKATADLAPMNNDDTLLAKIGKFDRRRLGGSKTEAIYGHLGDVGTGLVQHGFEGVQEISEAVASGPAGRVAKGVEKAIADYIPRRRQLGELPDVGVNPNESSIGAGLQANNNGQTLSGGSGSAGAGVEDDMDSDW